MNVFVSHLSFNIWISSMRQQNGGGLSATLVASPHQGRPASLDTSRTNATSIITMIMMIYASKFY